MVIVVGKLPDEIRVSQEQYIELLARLDQAIHSTSPTQTELARDVLDLIRPWWRQATFVGQEVEGQMELPLDWGRVANEAVRASEALRARG